MSLGISRNPGAAGGAGGACIFGNGRSTALCPPHEWKTVTEQRAVGHMIRVWGGGKGGSGFLC